MKHIVLSILIFLVYNNTFSLNTNVTVTQKIYTSNFAKVSQQVENFLSKHPNISILFKEGEKRSMKYQLLIGESDISDYKNFIKSFEYVDYDREIVQNIDKEVEKKEADILFLKNQIADYEKLIPTLDTKHQEYIALWKEIQNLKQQLKKEQDKLYELNLRDIGYKISLTIIGDSYEDQEYNNPTVTRYVNLPSIQYSFWLIEQPLRGFSAKYYNGFQMRYMFTRGKNSVYLGLYKAIGRYNDNTYTDIFLLGFGQDFYSRFMGRGLRKWFNPYTGYIVQTMLMTVNASQKVKFNCSIIPSLGLDIYKGKYVLWDIRASYNFPILYNKNLRGFEIATTFGVVF